MDIGSILFLLAILILVVFFISRPFFNNKSIKVFGEERKISSLLSEQERIINTLLELDSDHNLGKIPEEDYPTQRGLLLVQGAQIMRQVDALRAEITSGDYEQKIEDTLNSQQAPASDSSISKERSGKRVITTPDDDLEGLLAARRRERGEKAGGFCHQCGNPIQQSDRFCPKCGESLEMNDKKRK
jgi:hypothetical protein